MKGLTGIFILLAASGFSGVVDAQSTNPPAFQLTATLPPTNNVFLLPIVQFVDIPITTAIENLAIIANINYLIDPYRCQKLIGSATEGIPEPMVNCRLKNVTAREVLERMLNARNFSLVDDPFTHIARITSSDAPAPVFDASLLDLNTNSPTFATNVTSLPQIKFMDVPLDVAFENLIRVSELKMNIDPRITGMKKTFYEPNGVVVRDPKTDSQNTVDEVQADQRFVPMPILSVNWKNVSAKQAIIALCQNYDLIIVQDDTTNALLIKPDDGKKIRHHRRL